MIGLIQVLTAVVGTFVIILWLVFGMESMTPSSPYEREMMPTTRIYFHSANAVMTLAVAILFLMAYCNNEAGSRWLYFYGMIVAMAVAISYLCLTAWWAKALPDGGIIIEEVTYTR